MANGHKIKIEPLVLDITPVKVDGIEFDAMLSSEESYEAEVPAYTVEGGFEVTDDIIPRQPKLSMVLFVTPTPVTFTEHDGREPRTVVDDLKVLMEKRKPILVETVKENYTNMMIQKVSVRKSLEIGYAYEIDISFVRISYSPYKSIKMPTQMEISNSETILTPITVGYEDGSITEGWYSFTTKSNRR